MRRQRNVTAAAAAGRSALTVRCVESIGEVEAEEWNRLARNDVYAQHEWLGTIECAAVEARAPVYVLIYAERDLVGAAIGYRLDASNAPSSLEQQLFGRLGTRFAQLGISLRPALLCGPLIGQGRYVLWRRDLAAPQVERLLACALDSVSEIAARERRTLVLAKLPADEHALLAAVAGRGFARTMNWPVSYIDLGWDSFDAYVDHLSARGSSMATKARREISAPGKVGLRITRERPREDTAGEIFELMEATQRAHRDAPLPVASNFMHSLAEHDTGSSVVTVARVDGALAGAALLLTAGRHAGGPLIGVAHDASNRNAFTYFNLALYAPIRFCIENGIKRLYLGAGLYRMKQRRGCRELELVLLVKPRGALARAACRLACAVHRRWAVTKLRRQGVRLPAAREG